MRQWKWLFDLLPFTTKTISASCGIRTQCFIVEWRRFNYKPRPFRTLYGCHWYNRFDILSLICSYIMHTTLPWPDRIWYVRIPGDYLGRQYEAAGCGLVFISEQVSVPVLKLNMCPELSQDNLDVTTRQNQNSRRNERSWGQSWWLCF